MKIKALETARGRKPESVSSDLLFLKYFSAFGTSQEVEAEGDGLLSQDVPLSPARINFLVSRLFANTFGWHCKRGLALNMELTTEKVENKKENLTVHIEQMFALFVSAEDAIPAQSSLVSNLYGATPLLRLKHRVNKLEVEVGNVTVICFPYCALQFGLKLAVGETTSVSLTQFKLVSLPQPIGETGPWIEGVLQTDSDTMSFVNAMNVTFEDGARSSSTLCTATHFSVLQNWNDEDMPVQVSIRRFRAHLDAVAVPLLTKVIKLVHVALKQDFSPTKAKSSASLSQPPVNFRVEFQEGIDLTMPVASFIEPAPSPPDHFQSLFLFTTSSLRIMGTLFQLRLTQLGLLCENIKLCSVFAQANRSVGFLLDTILFCRKGPDEEEPSWMNNLRNESFPGIEIPSGWKWNVLFQKLRAAATSLLRAEEYGPSGDKKRLEESKGVDVDERPALPRAQGRMSAELVDSLRTSFDTGSSFDDGCMITPVSGCLYYQSGAERSLFLVLSKFRVRFLPGETLLGLSGILCVINSILFTVRAMKEEPQSMEDEEKEEKTSENYSEDTLPEEGKAKPPLQLTVHGEGIELWLHESSVSKDLQDIASKDLWKGSFLKQLLDAETANDHPLLCVSFAAYSVAVADRIDCQYSGNCTVYNADSLQWDEIVSIQDGRLHVHRDFVDPERTTTHWRIKSTAHQDTDIVVNLQKSLLRSLHPVFRTTSSLGIMTLAAILKIRSLQRDIFQTRQTKLDGFIKVHPLFVPGNHRHRSHLPFKSLPECLEVCAAIRKQCLPSWILTSQVSARQYKEGEREVTVVNSTGSDLLLRVGRPSTVDAKRTFVIPMTGIITVALPSSLFEPSSYSASSELYIEFPTAKNDNHWLRSTPFTVLSSFAKSEQLFAYEKRDGKPSPLFPNIEPRTKKVSPSPKGTVFVSCKKSISSSVLHLKSAFSVQNDSTKPLVVAVLPSVTPIDVEEDLLDAPENSFWLSNSAWLDKTDLQGKATCTSPREMESEAYMLGVLLPGCAFALPPQFGQYPAVYCRPAMAVEGASEGLPEYYTPWDVDSTPPWSEHPPCRFACDTRFSWATSRTSSRFTMATTDLPASVRQLSSLPSILTLAFLALNDESLELLKGRVPSEDLNLTTPEENPLHGMIQAGRSLRRPLRMTTRDDQFEDLSCWPTSSSGFSWLFPLKSMPSSPKPLNTFEEYDQYLKELDLLSIQEYLDLWHSSALHLTASLLFLEPMKALTIHRQGELVAAGVDIGNEAEEDSEGDTIPTTTTGILPGIGREHGVFRLNFAAAAVNALPLEACMELGYKTSSSKFVHVLTDKISPGGVLPLPCYSSQISLHVRLALHSQFSEWMPLRLNELHTPGSRVPFLRHALGYKAQHILSDDLQFEPSKAPERNIPVTVSRQVIDSESGAIVVCFSSNFWMVNTTLLAFETSCPSSPMSSSSDKIRVLDIPVRQVEAGTTFPLAWKAPQGAWSSKVTLSVGMKPAYAEVPCTHAPAMIHPIAVSCSLLSAQNTYFSILRNLLWKNHGKFTAEGYSSRSILGLRALSQVARRTAVVIISPRYVIYNALNNMFASEVHQAAAVDVWIEGVGSGDGFPVSEWATAKPLSAGHYVRLGSEPGFSGGAPHVLSTKGATLSVEANSVVPILTVRPGAFPLTRFRIAGTRWSQTLPLCPMMKTRIQLDPSDPEVGGCLKAVGVSGDTSPEYGTLRIRIEWQQMLEVRNRSAFWVVLSPLRSPWLNSRRWKPSDDKLIPPHSISQLPCGWGLNPASAAHIAVQKVFTAAAGDWDLLRSRSALQPPRTLATAIALSQGNGVESEITETSSPALVSELVENQHRPVPLLRENTASNTNLHYFQPFIATALGGASRLFLDASVDTTGYTEPQVPGLSFGTDRHYFSWMKPWKSFQDINTHLHHWDQTCMAEQPLSTSKCLPLPQTRCVAELASFPHGRIMLVPVSTPNETDEGSSSSAESVQSDQSMEDVNDFHVTYHDLAAVIYCRPLYSSAEKKEISTDGEARPKYSSCDQATHVLCCCRLDEDNGSQVAVPWVKRVDEARGVSLVGTVKAKVEWRPIDSIPRFRKALKLHQGSLKIPCGECPVDSIFLVGGGEPHTSVTVAARDQLSLHPISFPGTALSGFSRVPTGSIYYSSGEHRYSFDELDWELGCVGREEVGEEEEKESVSLGPTSPTSGASFTGYFSSWFSTPTVSDAEIIQSVMLTRQRLHLSEGFTFLPCTTVHQSLCIPTPENTSSLAPTIHTAPSDDGLEVIIEDQVCETEAGSDSLAEQPVIPVFSCVVEGNFQISLFDQDSKELVMTRCENSRLGFTIAPKEFSLNYAASSVAIYNMLPYTLSPVAFRATKAKENDTATGDAINFKLHLVRTPHFWHTVIRSFAVHVGTFDICFDQELMLRLLLVGSYLSRFNVLDQSIYGSGDAHRARLQWIAAWRSMLHQGLSSGARDLLQWRPGFTEHGHEGKRLQLEKAKDGSNHDRLRLFQTLWWEQPENQEPFDGLWLKRSTQLLADVSGLRQREDHAEPTLARWHDESLTIFDSVIARAFQFLSFGNTLLSVAPSAWVCHEANRFTAQALSLQEISSLQLLSVSHFALHATKGYLTLRPDPVFLRLATQTLKNEMKQHSITSPIKDLLHSTLGLLFGDVSLIKEPFHVYETAVRDFNGTLDQFLTVVQSQVHSSVLRQLIMLWAKLRAPGFKTLCDTVESVTTGVNDFVSHPLQSLSRLESVSGVPLALTRGVGSGAYSLMKGVVTGAGKLVSGLLSEVSERVDSITSVSPEVEERINLIPSLFGLVEVGPSPSDGTSETGNGNLTVAFSTHLLRSVTGVWEGPIEGAKSAGAVGAASGLFRGAAGLLLRPSSALLKTINAPIRKLVEGEASEEATAALKLVSWRPRGPRLRWENTSVTLPGSLLGLEFLIHTLRICGPSRATQDEMVDATRQTPSAISSEGVGTGAGAGAGDGAGGVLAEEAKTSTERSNSKEESLVPLRGQLPVYLLGEQYVGHILFPTRAHPVLLCFTTARVIVANMEWSEGYPTPETSASAFSFDDLGLKMRKFVWQYEFPESVPAVSFYSAAKSRVFDRCLDAYTTFNELQPEMALSNSLAEESFMTSRLVQIANPFIEKSQKLGLQALTWLDNIIGMELSRRVITASSVEVNPATVSLAAQYFRVSPPDKRIQLLDAVHEVVRSKAGDDAGADIIVPLIEKEISLMALSERQHDRGMDFSGELVQWVLACTLMRDVESQQLSEFYVASIGLIKLQ